MTQLVTFKENGFGSANDSLFEERVVNAGLDYTVLKQIDTIREQYLADVTTEALDYAENSGVGDGTGTGVTVSDISLGGHVSAHVHIDSSFATLVSVTTNYTDIMEPVLERSKTLWAQFNVTGEPEA
jgi:Rad3-related DNA helicase